MTISSMEPLLPGNHKLHAVAENIQSKANELGRHLHPRTLNAISRILRTVNCYYSNLIENHDTHPVNIEKAMRREYAEKTKERNLQLEAQAHIAVQVEMEKRIMGETQINVCSREFLCWLHKEFYSRLPEEFRIVQNLETGQKEPVIPGALRHHDVRVGRHIPPSYKELSEYLKRIADFFNPELFKGPKALVALAAAHHRILWIHPFGDGNGRVVRLMSDAYLTRINFRGYGLWTISRGIVRNREKYLALLAQADNERWNDLDGRGNLSEKALTEFCGFFLEICEDQIDYMNQMLVIEEFAERVLKYAKLRETGALPGISGRTDKSALFRPEASRLLHMLVFRGSIPRGEIPGLTGLEIRTSRRVVSFLNKEGFLDSSTSRAPIGLRIPAYAAPYFFPKLYNPI